MKKIFAMMLLFVLLASCARMGTTEQPTTLPTQTEPPTESLPTTRPADTYTRPSSIKVYENQDDLESYGYKIHYRYIYYVIDGAFGSLVPWDEYEKWREARMKSRVAQREPSEMLLVTFLKAFKIPRAVFDEAVKDYIDGLAALDYLDMDERYEVPNADIIYTFDNEIINDYYRRDR